MHKIIIAAESQKIRESLQACFKDEQYEILTAEDGPEVLVLLSTHKPLLVVMTGTLPVIAGVELCRQIRKLSEVPLICGVEKNDVELGIACLEQGADDFMTLPVNEREMSARVQAVWRRCHSEPNIPEHVHFVNFDMDLATRKVMTYGKEVTLTNKEFELLWLLTTHANRAFSRMQLLREVWGQRHTSDTRTVDTHIKKLRQKLNAGADSTWHIATVWSVGYKFEVLTDI